MPGTRLFFVICMIITAGLAGLLITAIGGTNPPLTESVSAGQALWQKFGCEGCHTLYGIGGGYAPDLTHIVESRGESYLREFFVNPNAFHPKDRLMPRFTISVSETGELIDFLAWVGQAQAGANFPPRTINVSGGGGLSGADNASSDGEESDALAQGREIYSRRCASCHSIEPEIVNLGPSLAGIADRGWYRVQGQNAEQYIRNSILYPSDYLVPGFSDIMQKNFAELMSSQDLDNLMIFLLSLTEEQS